MQCVLCGRALFTAALSVPTRNGPLAYGPKCARKAGLLQNAGQRITHVQKTAPRACKPPSRAIGIQDNHTPDLFQEEMKP